MHSYKGAVLMSRHYPFLIRYPLMHNPEATGPRGAYTHWCWMNIDSSPLPWLPSLERGGCQYPVHTCLLWQCPIHTHPHAYLVLCTLLVRVYGCGLAQPLYLVLCGCGMWVWTFSRGKKIGPLLHDGDAAPSLPSCADRRHGGRPEGSARNGHRPPWPD